MTSFAEANKVGEAMPDELARVSRYKAQLEQLGVPADGRFVSLESDSKDVPGVRNKETVWLLGNRVLGELHCTGTGQDNQGWFRRIVDVDLETGELNIYAQSQKGEGGGTSNILTGEDFWPMIDGVKVRQLQSSMYRVWQNLLTGESAQIELSD